MAQFDVLRTKGSTTYPLVLEIQADLHTKLATRVVVPLVSRARYALPATRLTPTVRVRDEEYVVLVPLIATVPKSALGAFVASLSAQRATLIAAVDLLVTGS
jgi:toxin CcdB